MLHLRLAYFRTALVMKSYFVQCPPGILFSDVLLITERPVCYNAFEL